MICIIESMRSTCVANSCEKHGNLCTKFWHGGYYENLYHLRVIWRLAWYIAESMQLVWQIFVKSLKILYAQTRNTMVVFWRLTNDKYDCMLTGRPFEETFKNAQQRKFKQMQSMWLCILTCRPFQDTFENVQQMKAKQMQPVRLCIL